MIYEMESSMAVWADVMESLTSKVTIAYTVVTQKFRSLTQ